MNAIKSKIDKSDYQIYDDFRNIEIDGNWLDEILDQVYPNRMLKGLIPTLLFSMEIDEEKAIVWDRINPTENSKSTCPILMCPDDCDFSCTLIVAEIENFPDKIKWNRIGLDRTMEYDVKKVGTSVEWFDKIGPFEFEKTAYAKMIAEFETQLKIDQSKWEIQNIEFHNRT